MTPPEDQEAKGKSRESVEDASPDSNVAEPPQEPAADGESNSHEPVSYDGDPYGDDAYGYGSSTAIVEQPGAPAPAPPSGGAPPPAAPSEPEEEGEDEEGMLRMSFLEHLEELRRRLIHMVAGLGVSFAVCIFFASELWTLVSEPAVAALTRLGYKETSLAQISPMEAFSIVYIKLPLLAALFLGSPWLLYQVWAFIAPGLYKRERRWAVPFVVCSAGLFVLGGLFGYFVAFRFGLEFLLGIGRDINIQPYISVTEYFDLFVNVMLGIGIVFELPVLIFFLTLLRITTPAFLIRNSRYAVLGIVILAAVITPTPDVINLVLFSVPMVLLYFLGVFASFLLVLHREKRRFPWGKLAIVILVLLLVIGALGYLAVSKYGYSLVPQWPFLVR